MRVRELCAREPVTIPPEATAGEAARCMEHHRVRTLIVVDEQERPVGVVTERDLVRRIVALDLDPSKVRASAVMTHDPVVLAEHASMHDAVQRMRAYSVRRLPVVDGEGRTVGLINLRDVLGCLAGDLKEVESLMAGRTNYWDG